MRRVIKVAAGSRVEGAGVLDGIKGILTKLDGMLDKIFKNLGDSDPNLKGIQIDTKSSKAVSTPEGKGEESSISFPGDPKPIGTLTKVPNSDGTVTLIFKMRDNSTKTIEGVDASGIEKAVSSYLSEYMKKQFTKANKVLQVTLQRVQAGRGYNIDLIAVNANYAADQCIDNLNAVLSDASILGMIDDTPISLQIMDDGGEELSVEEIPSLESNNGLGDMLAAATVLMCNLQFLHWNVRGKQFSDLHSRLNDWYHTVKWNIDELGELQVELQGSAPNIGCIIDPTLLIPSDSVISPDEVYSVIQNHIMQYICTLEMYYVNFNHDIQSLLDNMIRFWRKECEYRLKQTMSE